MGGIDDFMRDLNWSDSADIGTPVASILLSNIHGAACVERASTADDKSGTDYWVTLHSGRRVSIDVKARRVDFGKDDVALELWSVVGKVKGWTLDQSKHTDYILFLWEDSGRWCIIPFIMLMTVFKENGCRWIDCFQYATQTTSVGSDTWHSMCVFVPRREIWNAIYHRYNNCG